MTEGVETNSGLSLPSPKERRRLRESADLTYEQVAAAVGVTVTTVRSWEWGRTDPRGSKREAYATFLATLATPPAAEPAAARAPASQSAEAEPDTPEPEPVAETPHAAAPRTALGIARPFAGRPAGAGQSAPLEADPAPPAIDAPPEANPAPPAFEALGVPPAVAGGGPGGRAPAAAPQTASGGAAAEQGGAGGGQSAEAFDALYGHAAPTLVRQTYLLTGRRALAQEAVERAFHQAWSHWPEVATDPDPVGWVRAAAYEYALSPWHQLRRAHRHPDKSPAEPADRILLEAVLALPTTHRRTVVLYDGVGLDLPDTAAETEASTPTAGSRLLHAHADLAVRIPELADVPPEKQSALLRERIAALRPAVRLEPRPAALVRTSGERRTRRWTRAAVGLTAVIAAATAYTAVTAPTHYEPPNAPGESVSGVPPHSGPQRLTQESRALHDKLRADPAAGPNRLAPRSE
ncbi:helix-turn-helix domain-containing protein [Streptomyces sp. NPDC048337]|uniref:helix-turn-helix domain-containing protein n=1 Tax=Streptomyces sp. NPDC048337 TaxID=3365535 RepID=UPI00371E61E6